MYNLKNYENILPPNHFFSFNNYNDINEFFELLYNYTRHYKYNLNNNIDYSIYNIPKYLAPRKSIPIKNKYIIKKKNNDIADYHFVIYYLEDYKCNIIIRRLDSIYGWTDSFNIIIDDNEIIKIRRNKENFLIFDYNTKTKLEKTNLDQKQLISKIIIQTGKSNKAENLLHYNSILSLIELNPEYEYMHFNHEEVITFLKSKYPPEVYAAYDKIIPGAYRADLFRYCMLNYYGGCYFDNKQINRIPLREVIKPNKEIMLCKDFWNNHSYYNAIIFTNKNNIIMQRCINQCVKNIQNNYYGSCHLCPTGPCLLYKCAEGYPYDLKLNSNVYLQLPFLRHKSSVSYEDKIICNTSYYNYYTDIKKGYLILWIKKSIYKN